MRLNFHERAGKAQSTVYHQTGKYNWGGIGVVIGAETLKEVIDARQSTRMINIYCRKQLRHYSC